ncbi:MAG TPA: hypothetical protein VJ801_17635 [Polyangia bacterium]|nr:hypothetical protein [Polyangia bacterium]
MSTTTGQGYLCKTCGRTLISHSRNPNGACLGRKAPNLDDDATPVLERAPTPTAVDQREADMADVAKRMRNAVYMHDVAQCLGIARSCWDSGYTARDRRGKGAP